MKYDAKIFTCNMVTIGANMVQVFDVSIITKLLGFATAMISFIVSVVLLIIRIRAAVKAKNLTAFLNAQVDFEKKAEELTESIKEVDENAKRDIHDGRRETDDSNAEDCKPTESNQ